MKDIDHNAAVRQITQTLKGPVAAIFRELIPAFGDLDGQEFYDAVMGSSDLLHGCMLIFRKRRDAFANLLVDDHGRPVNDDFVALRCGRSVHDIFAMILRSHAKSQFRVTLGGDPNDPNSKSGRLYQAMNEYLIHEWQVPLVSHYAAIPAAQMRELGPMLLDLKTAAEVDAVVARSASRRASVAPPEPPAPPANANREAVAPPEPSKPQTVVLESNSREQDFWWETLNDPQVRQALGSLSETGMRELTADFCRLGDATRSELLAPLGLSLYQAAVLMGMCHRSLGRAGFGQIFGRPGRPALVTAFTTKLKAQGVTSRSDLRTLARAVEGVLATMPAGGGTAAQRPRAAAGR